MANSNVKQSQRPGHFGESGREATLNWLALGLLLAAWNACDNDVAAKARPRPEGLRGYHYVSVRAANRIAQRE
jgi:hypothetical protein